jgi:hypothetical protein
MSEDTVLRDILVSIRERRYKKQNPIQDAAAKAFAALNGWRYRPNGSFAAGQLGRGIRATCYWQRPWQDHALYFSAERRNVAIVGQPYQLIDGDVADFEGYISKGYALHFPPNPYASIWYPGATLFLVLTLGSVDVRWLPEQRTLIKELLPWVQKDFVERDTGQLSRLFPINADFLANTLEEQL